MRARKAKLVKRVWVMILSVRHSCRWKFSNGMQKEAIGVYAGGVPLVSLQDVKARNEGG